MNMKVNGLEGLLEFFQRRHFKTWHIVLMSEIIAERLKELPKVELPKVEIPRVELPKEVPKFPLPKSFTIDLKNLFVSKSYSIVDVNKPGTLKEFVVISPSNKFSVLVLVDGAIMFNRTFNELAEISRQMESIVAFEDDGTYIIGLYDLSWLKEFKLKISVEEPITFKTILALYDLMLTSEK